MHEWWFRKTRVFMNIQFIRIFDYQPTVLGHRACREGYSLYIPEIAETPNLVYDSV